MPAIVIFTENLPKQPAVQPSMGFSGCWGSSQDRLHTREGTCFLRQLMALEGLQPSGIVLFQLLRSCPTNCDPMDCSTPGFPVIHYLPEFAQTHVHWFNDAIQPSHSLLPPSPPALNLSKHQVFSKELALHIRWPKYWSFSFNISLSNEYSGLISFRIDWCNLHAIQGTLGSLLQHHSLKVSILWHSVFTVQLSQLYMTTGKTIALTIQAFVGKVI